MKLTDKLAELSGKATKGLWIKAGEEDSVVLSMPESQKTKYNAIHYFCGGGFNPLALPEMLKNVELICELRNSLDTLLEVIKIYDDTLEHIAEYPHSDDYILDQETMANNVRKKVSALLEVGE